MAEWCLMRHSGSILISLFKTSVILLGVLFFLRYILWQRNSFESITSPVSSSRIGMLVVVTCDRQNTHVEVTIQSIINQKHKNWAMILIDNGSPNHACKRRADDELKRHNLGSQNVISIHQDTQDHRLSRKEGVQNLISLVSNATIRNSRLFVCFLDAGTQVNPTHFGDASAMVEKFWSDIVYSYLNIESNGMSHSASDVGPLSLETISEYNFKFTPVLPLISLDFFSRFPIEMTTSKEDTSFLHRALSLGASISYLKLTSGPNYHVSDGLMPSSLATAVGRIENPGLFPNKILISSIDYILASSELFMKRYSFFIENIPKTCDGVYFLWLLSRQKHGLLRMNDSATVLEKCVNESYFNLNRELLVSHSSDKKSDITKSVVTLNTDKVEYLRCRAHIGGFISETRAATATSRFQSNSSYCFVVVSTNENLLASRLVIDIKKIPAVTVIYIVESDVLSAIRQAEHRLRSSNSCMLVGLYLEMNGQEQLFLNFAKEAKLFNISQFGIIILKYKKRLLDKFGPLPANEFVIRTFGDIGMSFLDGVSGEKVTKDSDMLPYLNNFERTHLIMQNPMIKYQNKVATTISSATSSKQLVLFPSSPIPKIVHFVFGLSSSPVDQRFEMHHYLAIKAAKDTINPTQIYFHYDFLPTGDWWVKAKQYVTLNHVKKVTSIFGNNVTKFAHKADVVRLEALMKYGGIYLDIDVLVYKNFDHLLDGKYDLVMGEEGYFGSVGLCNAVIMAKADSQFLKLWYSEYSTFNSERWNEHSVMLPKKLSIQYPSLIHVLPHTALFWPLWDSHGLSRLYMQNQCPWFEFGYAVHLWSTLAHDHLVKLTLPTLWDSDTCYFKLARKIYFSSEFASIQDVGVEVSDIVFGVAIESLGESELLARSIGPILSRLNSRYIIFTRNTKVYELFQRRHFHRGSLVVLLPYNTKKGRYSYLLLQYLYKDFPYAKWYFIIDGAKSLFRPDLFREALAILNPDLPFYLASPGYLEKVLKPSDNRNVLSIKDIGKIGFHQPIVRQMMDSHLMLYGLSAGAIRSVIPSVDICQSLFPSGAKNLFFCLRKIVGINITCFPMTFVD